MSKSDKTVWVSPFFENAGYSYMSRRFVKELIGHNFDIGIESIQCNFEITKEEAEYFYKLRRYDANGKPSLYHFSSDKENKDIIKILCWIPLPNIPKYKHNVLYTMMETKDLSPSVSRTINTFYDSCWVPTQYYKDCFERGNVRIPIDTIPVGIDEKFNPDNIDNDYKFNFKVFEKGKDCYFDEPKGFRFLSLFRWTYRKGFDVLLKSYLREFRDTGDVSLVIVSRHVASSSQQRFYDAVEADIRRFVEEYGEGSPPVYWCYDNIPNDKIPSIYSKGDVFVMPSRGDGLNLPTLEASQMGLPVIIPNHTGFTDYATHENSYLLDVDKWIKCNQDPGWSGWITRQFFDQEFPLFGDSVCCQTAAYMRHIMDHMEEAKEKNRKMREIIKEKYSWEKCTLAAEKKLLEIR